tara:strand:+ start:768 stop:2750 length:1983 start_codon:yes stop_codon:yes gene_type:complete
MVKYGIKMKQIIYIVIFSNFYLFGNYHLNNREVIKNSTISQSGLILLSDILLLSNQIRVNTVDGFSWFATINALDTFDNQDWVIMVDNHKIDIETFDLININFLPININEIDSIEVIASPHLYGDFFSETGLIHIHTFSNNKHITAAASAGNESGDPGPYRYVEGNNSPNVEYAQSLGMFNFKYKNNKNFYKFGFHYGTYPFTDLPFKQRIRNILFENGRVIGKYHSNRYSIFTSINRKIKNSELNFLASYIYSDKHFIFLKTIGMELPSQYNNAYVGLNYNIQLSDKSYLAYKINYTFNHLDKYPNTLNFNFDYNLENFHTSIEHHTININSRLITGLAFDRFKLNTDYVLRKSYYNIYKFYGSLYYKLNPYFDNKFDAMAILSDDKFAIKSSYSAEFKINYKNKVNLTASYLEKLLNQNSNLWYWQNLGYDLINTNYLNDINFKKNKIFTIDLIFENNSLNQIDIIFKNYFRSFQDIDFEDYSYSFNSDNGFIILDSLSIFSNQALKTVGLNISLKNKMNDKIKHFLSYDIQLGLSKDYLLDSFKKIPSKSLKYHLIYSVIENFSIWLRFNYLSSSVWEDYEMVDNAIYNTILGEDLSYSNKIKSFHLLDVGLQKWFFNEKIKTNIFLRNILNQNYQYHPIGMTFDLSLYFELVFYPI